MVFLIPLPFLAAVGLWAVFPPKTAIDSSVILSSASAITDLFSNLRQPNMMYLILILFSYILSWPSFAGFFPTDLVQKIGMSSSSASLLFSVFFAFGIVVKTPIRDRIRSAMNAKLAHLCPSRTNRRARIGSIFH
jgi:hypothetical protein